MIAVGATGKLIDNTAHFMQMKEQRINNFIFKEKCKDHYIFEHLTAHYKVCVSEIDFITGAYNFTGSPETQKQYKEYIPLPKTGYKAIRPAINKEYASIAQAEILTNTSRHFIKKALNSGEVIAYSDSETKQKMPRWRINIKSLREYLSKTLPSSKEKKNG